MGSSFLFLLVEPIVLQLIDLLHKAKTYQNVLTLNLQFILFFPEQSTKEFAFLRLSNSILHSFATQCCCDLFC